MNREAASPSRPVGRFAPTPSGSMHLGNLFSCLLAWLSARSAGGRMIMRMENLDTQRTSVEFGERLMRDLEFLGLDWDEGPYWQSERGGHYQECLDRLTEQGLVYPCFCSRAELHAADAPHASDGDYIYQGACRGLSMGEIGEKSRLRSPAMRLRAEGRVGFQDLHYGWYEQDLQRDCGDFLLQRSDGVFAYQLAVVADDGAMGVTEVVRGRDLMSSGPRQLYLYRLLGLQEPEFAHIPMLLAEDGRRLSKRDADMGLDSMRQRLSAGEIVGRLGYLAGLTDRPEAASPRELLDGFSWEKVKKEDIFLPKDLF